jgi:DNA-binding transcriptional ArsR family regulator
VCELPSNSEEETYSVMFSSLRHSVRRKILRLLATGSRTFTEVLEQVGVEGSFLSYHLESLGELVIKDDGKYALSDLGFAAVSLMTRVEEPLKEVLSSKKTLRRIYPKPLLVVMTFTLIILIGTGIYIGALNTQLERTLLEERGRVVNGVSYSLFALSGSGLPGPIGREEYSNIGLVFLQLKTLIFTVFMVANRYSS